MRLRPNPTELAGVSVDTWILLGIGTAILGAIVYGVYTIGEAADVLADTNDRISDATDAANGVSDQIGQAIPVAQNVGDQIGAANQTVQQEASSPAAQAAQGLAAWWNSW